MAPAVRLIVAIGTLIATPVAMSRAPTQPQTSEWMVRPSSRRTEGACPRAVYDCCDHPGVRRRRLWIGVPATTRCPKCAGRPSTKRLSKLPYLH